MRRADDSWQTHDNRVAAGTSPLRDRLRRRLGLHSREQSGRGQLAMHGGDFDEFDPANPMSDDRRITEAWQCQP